MFNIDKIPSKDIMLSQIKEKYSEWLEMSENPQDMLINILTTLLHNAENTNIYLNSVLSETSNCCNKHKKY